MRVWDFLTTRIVLGVANACNPNVTGGRDGVSRRNQHTLSKINCSSFNATSCVPQGAMGLVLVMRFRMSSSEYVIEHVVYMVWSLPQFSWPCWKSICQSAGCGESGADTATSSDWTLSGQC